MHWTPHSSLGVATIVFYSPLLHASLWLLRRHGSPRMAWSFMALMCCVRIVSGVLLILYESGGSYHTDLSTSASIMLGVGIFPLVFAIVGWLYIFQTFDTKSPRQWLRWGLLGIRGVGVAALALIIAGSVTLGPVEKSADGQRVGDTLVKAGALLVVAILAICIGLLCGLWVEMIRIKSRARVSNLMLAMLSLAAVLLILRAAYMCLVIFRGGPSSMWNPLDGSLDVLVRLSLLPEYIVVLLMVAFGVWLSKVTKGDLHRCGEC